MIGLEPVVLEHFVEMVAAASWRLVVAMVGVEAFWLDKSYCC